MYEQAFVVNPDSPMVGFRRAKALASIGRIDVRPLDIVPGCSAAC